MSVSVVVGATLLGLAMVARDVVLKVKAAQIATLDQHRIDALEAQAADHEKRVHYLETKQPMGGRR